MTATTASGTTLASPPLAEAAGWSAAEVEVATGPVNDLPAGQVLALLASLPGWSSLSGKQRDRWVSGATRVLEWLQTHPGAGWQQRWLAAGADDLVWIDELAADGPSSLAWQRDEVRCGLIGLLLCRVVLPSYEF
ncbi:hypothetical protein GCM10009745_20610 [Kribbella yunnanensis]|uniref:Uncharacterized protein n=1 Tax=Kribbella yunnanensis TaxID=190194 RepID=A0ABP4STR6_9ACTN